MKKQATALALALAGFSAQDAFATVAVGSIAAGSVVQLGCTAPSSSGSTVYSVDAQAINAVGSQDVIALPSGVSSGANCSYALNQMALATGLTTTVTGKWIQAGITTGVDKYGTTPVNVTIPGSGYSLITYTFVAN